MSVEALSWAKQQTVGSTNRKATLLLLADIASEHGVLWASTHYLARVLECNRSTVSGHLTALEQAGIILRVERREAGTRRSTVTVLAPAADRGTMLDPTEHEIFGPLVTLCWKSQRGESQRCESQHHTVITKDTSQKSRRRVGVAGGGDQTSLDVSESRVEALLSWHSNQVCSRGLPAPVASAPARKAARELLQRASGDELRSMFAFAIGRTFWASKVVTIPKWKQHYTNLKVEWLASRETAQRNGTAPKRETNWNSVDLTGERMVVS